jgi:hypothetical protein
MPIPPVRRLMRVNCRTLIAVEFESRRDCPAVAKWHNWQIPIPATLYKEKWLKLQDVSAEIRASIEANEAQLETKE